MSLELFAVAGGLAAAAGASLLYLASPNQQATRRRPPRRRLAATGAAAEGLALICFLQVAGPATAVFIWMTVAMLVWSIVPLLAAWRAAGAEQ